MLNPEGSPELLLKQILSTFPSTDVTITNVCYILDLFLEYLLREENNVSQPEVILKWLIGWLENVSTISWNVAHRVCHLISTIIIHCNYFLHAEDLLWILDRIVKLNKEIDVNNRAELLKTLMFTLSQEKLKKIFLQTPDFNESNVSEISLNVTNVRKFPIIITKLPYYSTATSYSEQKCATDYLKYIEDVESNRSTLFKLQLTLSPSSEHDLQALVIMLAVAEGFGNYEPIYIGNFKVEEKECSAFIHCHLKMPYPTLCNLRAEYSIRNRLMSCDLPALHFTFFDFFRQLPVAEIERSTLFPELWSLLKSKGAFQSFLLLELNCEDIEEKLNTKLTPFIVSRNDGDSNKPTCIAIYLPPGKHLLFQFYIDHNKTKVTILSDSTYVFSHTNNFLKDL